LVNRGASAPFGDFMRKDEKQEEVKDNVACVKMKHMDTGVEADVHPDEVDNYFNAGYRDVK